VYPVRIRERLMDSAYPAWFMLCASSLLDGRGMSLQGKLWSKNLRQIPAMHYYEPRLKDRSRELKNRSTLAEVLLWNQLKHHKMLGYSFLRQRPVYKYIVDFYCPKLD
jgi:hypothetical protein